MTKLRSRKGQDSKDYDSLPSSLDRVQDNDPQDVVFIHERGKVYTFYGSAGLLLSLIPIILHKDGNPGEVVSLLSVILFGQLAYFCFLSLYFRFQVSPKGFQYRNFHGPWPWCHVSIEGTWEDDSLVDAQIWEEYWDQHNLGENSTTTAQRELRKIMFVRKHDGNNQKEEEVTLLAPEPMRQEIRHTLERLSPTMTSRDVRRGWMKFTVYSLFRSSSSSVETGNSDSTVDVVNEDEEANEEDNNKIVIRMQKLGCNHLVVFLVASVWILNTAEHAKHPVLNLFFYYALLAIIVIIWSIERWMFRIEMSSDDGFFHRSMSAGLIENKIQEPWENISEIQAWERQFFIQDKLTLRALHKLVVLSYGDGDETDSVTIFWPISLLNDRLVGLEDYLPNICSESRTLYSVVDGEDAKYIVHSFSRRPMVDGVELQRQKETTGGKKSNNEALC